MSHADQLLNLCENYAYALASASKVSENRAEYLASRDKHRAALREACEKLCGALDDLIDASSPFGPIDDGSVVWSKTRTELGFAITDARSALAHLTKGTA